MAIFLVYVYPVLLAAVLATLLALLALNARALASACGAAAGSRGRAAAAAVALFVVALVLRLWLSPGAHQVYFDEFDHLDVAGNLARGGALARTLVGGRDDASVLTPTLWPGGWHLLLAGALRLCGHAADAPFVLNAVLGALSVPLLAFAGALLLRDAAAGLAAAALLCLHPVHVQYSGAGDTTVSSVLALTLVLTCWAFHRDRQDGRSYWLLLAAISWALQTRLEHALLLPLAFTASREARARPLAVAVFLASLLPLAALVWRNRMAAVPGFAQTPWTMLENVANNAPVNLRYLLEPLGLLVLAPCLFVLARRARSETRLPAALALAYFLLYSAYHLGRFPESSQSRYALNVLVPLLLLAGGGLSVLPPRGRGRALVLAAFFGSFGLLARASYMEQSSPLLAKEEEFLRASARLLPERAFVVAVSPAAVLAAARRPALSAHWCLSEAKACADLRARDGELVLFKDFLWHLRERELAPLEAALRAEYDFALLAEIEVDRRPCALHLLTPRRGVSSTK